MLILLRGIPIHRKLRNNLLLYDIEIIYRVCYKYCGVKIINEDYSMKEVVN